jgi:isoquinoline 1-oxidoreductase beta subunit
MSRSTITPHELESNATETRSALSRRHFLSTVSAGSIVLMARLGNGQDVQVATASAVDPEAFNPDLFLQIAPDGTVTIVAHRSEMGTGIRTSLPRVVADELEADWDRCVIDQAIGNKELGSQNTDGSNSIVHFFDRMRVAGATARTMLERAAAKQWNVSAEECQGRLHQVVHTKSDRRADYGDLVAIAKTLEVPQESELKMKPSSQWRYVGKDAPITDLDQIVTGKAIYGIDARMENQLFAVIARPPVVGGKVKSFDASATKEVPGVVEVIEIPGFSFAPVFQPLGGIAVCANSTWAAIQGRDALQIEWDHGANAVYNSDQYAQQLKETVNQPGKERRNDGDALSILAKADQKVTADYSVPHLSHAPMETTCALADVRTDETGKVTFCHLVTATQNPQAVQQAVAPALKISQDEVICDVTLLGSGFGRKSKPDYCVEAALLSKQMKRPVHVTWTREDDIAHDYYHTVSALHMEAATAEDGLPTAWLIRAAYPTITSTFNPMSDTPSGMEIEMARPRPMYGSVGYDQWRTFIRILQSVRSWMSWRMRRVVIRTSSYWRYWVRIVRSI